MKQVQTALLVAGAFCLTAITTLAQSEPVSTASVTVTLDLKHPGAAIPENFIGLSFETSLLLPNENGWRYFRPDNQPLINLLHTLGVKSLRIGGNTSDRDAKQLPGPADWDSLFGFAKAAGVKVIYCLQLHNGDPQVAAQTVKYIMDRYAPLVDCFSIGQEPSAYPVAKVDNRPESERMESVTHQTFAACAGEWKRFADAIIAAVPEVKFCGPGVHNDSLWARKFIGNFGSANHVALITEHLYPGGAGGKVPTPEIGRQRMLSDDFIKTYQKLHDGFVPLAAANGLPYRLEEVNNFYNGGAAGVSDTFAAALWGTDFMYWWAEHGAAGLNFHTGDHVAAGSRLVASKYTAFFSIANGYAVRPLSYGIKLFELGSHGNFIPSSTINPEKCNVSVHAVLGENQNVYVTVINKELGTNARTAKLVINLGDNRFADAESMRMTGFANAVSPREKTVLGEDEIHEDGSWYGKWTALASASGRDAEASKFQVELAPASAIIIRFTK